MYQSFEGMLERHAALAKPPGVQSPTSIELFPSASVQVATLPLEGRGAKANAFTLCLARSTCAGGTPNSRAGAAISATLATQDSQHR